MLQSPKRTGGTVIRVPAWHRTVERFLCSVEYTAGGYTVAPSLVVCRSNLRKNHSYESFTGQRRGNILAGVAVRANTIHRLAL